MKKILATVLLMLVALLSGCGKSSPTFAGIDLTGAEVGRDFSVTDHDGKPRTLADFRGKYVMIFFGYTHCPDVCPTALARAVAVRKLLGADAERLQVIFVTVDPERDTAALLKGYTTAFDPGVLGLRGDAEQTRAGAKEFRVVYEKVPTGSSYAMDHTAITYIIDAQGRIRLAMRHAQTAEEYAADLKTLMKLDSPT